jgi:hypothetical protein
MIPVGVATNFFFKNMIELPASPNVDQLKEKMVFGSMARTSCGKTLNSHNRAIEHIIHVDQESRFRDSCHTRLLDAKFKV